MPAGQQVQTRIYVAAAPQAPVARAARTKHGAAIGLTALVVLAGGGASILTSSWGQPHLSVSQNFRNLTLTFESDDHQTTRQLYYGDNPETLFDAQSLTALPKVGCEISRNASNLRPGVYFLVAMPIASYPGEQSYIAREIRRYNIWSQNLYAETAIRRCHASAISTSYQIQNGWTALILDRYKTIRGPLVHVQMER